MKSNVLFESDNHIVISFNDLVTGEGIQANQLVIIHNGHSAVFDPGGDLTYMPLSMAIAKYVRVKDVDYVIATHQDPDIVSSLDKWLMYSDAKVVISKLWERFVPHLVPGYMKEKGLGRMIAIPDEGMNLDLGGATIKAIPAHFLHSVGNFHFYDSISKILFSGDMGASLVDDASEPVENFEQHIKSMSGFHRRYMVSNKVCRFWVNMVRQMDVDMIVPQHGQPFKGKAMIEKFLKWVENLECGIDNVHQQYYTVP
ncbi:MBL fold metallo-hydrolase [Kaarinaea lacus]